MRRLAAEWYRGYAFVHWSMSIDSRVRGWLNREFHLCFREIQLHALARFRLLCPAYCLMPEHLHMLWAGVAENSDQDKAATLFRRQFNAALPGDTRLQKQAWDVVLREKDRERDAVVKTAFYIAQNPVRAGLESDADAWSFSGAQAVGYPQFDWRDADYPTKLWKIYDLQVREWLSRRPEPSPVPLRGQGTDLQGSDTVRRPGTLGQRPEPSSVPLQDGELTESERTR
jgi:putative transposase